MPLDLAASLLRRLDAHERGDHQAVLDPAALAETEAVLAYSLVTPRAAPPCILDREGLRLVALLHSARWAARGWPETDADRNTAVRLFTLLAPYRPDAVPARLRDAVAAADGPAAHDLMELESRALEAYRRWGTQLDPGALEEAVSLWRHVAGVLPKGHPGVPMAHSHLCAALRDRFVAHRGAHRPDLTEAVAAGRLAVASAAPDDPDRWMYSGNLSGALTMLHQVAPEEADPREAVAAATDAVRRAPRPHAAYYGHLGAALLLRGQRTPARAEADLDGAIDAFTAAARYAAADDPQRAGYLSNRAVALHTRYLTAEDPDDTDLADALEAAALAARISHPADPERVAHLANHCTVLLTRAERTRSAADAEALLAAERAALAAAPDDDWRASRLCSLSRALRLRFTCGGERRHLNEAVRAARQAVRLVGGRATGPLGELALALLETSLHAPPTGGEAEFREAVGLLARLRGAVGPQDEPGPLIDRLTEVGGVLIAGALGHDERPAVVRDSDLDRALAVLHLAADLMADRPAPSTPEARRLVGRVVTALGEATAAHYDRTGDPAALDEAVAHLDRAVSLTVAGPAAPHARALTLLGLALRKRGIHRDSVADLHRAVEVSATAVDRLPLDDPQRPGWQSHLAVVLLARYRRLRTESDLEEALRTSRASLAAASGAPPWQRAVLLTNLGAVLRETYFRTNALSDLDEAIDAFRDAVRASEAAGRPPGEAAGLLAEVLAERHHRSGLPADLDEAIDAGRRGVAAFPANHVGRADAVIQLAIALQERAAATGRAGDAQEAVAHLRQAVDALPTGMPVRERAVAVLCVALLSRAETTGSITDLDEVIALAGPALDRTPSGHLRAVSLLTALGMAHTARFMATGDDTDLRAARDVFRTAAGLRDLPPLVHFSHTAHWALRSALLEDWEESVRAYEQAVAQLPLLAWHGLALADRVRGFAATDSIGCDAAAAALNAGRPQQALHLLERSRGILLARATDARFSPQALAEEAPDLARRIAELNAELYGPEADPLGRPGADPDDVQRAEDHRRRRLTRELDTLLHRALAVLGLEDTVAAPTPQELQDAAGEGPVIVINASFLRCDAFLVTADALRTVPLPELYLDGPGGAGERAGALLAALADPGAAPQEAEAVLRATLDWLAKTVVDPVLRELDARGGVHERLWWCPTGPLALLPLHAAGVLPDQYVCSYATTLRSLADARARDAAGARADTADRVLVVDEAALPGLRPLSRARREAMQLYRRDPQHRTLLASAPRHVVRRQLAHHAVLHFAGHAEHVPADPARSGLYCADHADAGPLTVEEIARLRLERARLAFLSACETARGAAAVPDEGVHLAGALQLAGYPHVVAAQWPVADHAAHLLTEHFYAELDTDGRLDPSRTAHALHRAVRHLRDTDPNPLLWAAFVHSGP
ncbi:CHAT domain-containing protein [Streptomyces mexicanus]|uniref:CHAT domain-containing protein n=1 Tax=Streptomyces mexicanus TaxID=178566 RepID=A0A7X1I633_9ACTN|nr:CHAT domain-containing protein [Streptomyces mexicanus]MBC2869447.1 CHAT domain-containing protein [Streptomyces mexicanus]